MATLLDIRFPADFEERYKAYKALFPVVEDFGQAVMTPTSVIKRVEKFTITLRDREVWITDFLLSKPYGAGKNMAFLEYILENPDRDLQREEMPVRVQNEAGGKNFGKILNALGFKGEILKAFAPKRGKSSLLFRKEVLKAQLESEGINVPLFLLELNLAHTKNTPKSSIVV